MNCLEIYPDYTGLYSWNNGDSERDLDLRDRGIPGIPDLSQGDSIDSSRVTPWVTDTRTYLDDPDNSEINVVLWSGARLTVMMPGDTWIIWRY